MTSKENSGFPLCGFRAKTEMIDQGTMKPRTANHVLQKANPKLEQDGNYMQLRKLCFHSSQGCQQSIRLTQFQMASARRRDSTVRGPWYSIGFWKCYDDVIRPYTPFGNSSRFFCRPSALEDVASKQSNCPNVISMPLC